MVFMRFFLLFRPKCFLILDFLSSKFIFIFIFLHQQKERNPEKDLWRNSWGSNQSFVGKDEFWLALQSNYNFIMDTNLIDSCREARGELERNYFTETSHPDQKKVRSTMQYIHVSSCGSQKRLYFLKQCKNKRKNVFKKIYLNLF